MRAFMSLRDEEKAAKLAQQAMTSLDAGIAMLEQVRVWEHGPDIAWRVADVVQQGAPISEKLELLLPWAVEIVEGDLDEARVARRWDLRLHCGLSVLLAVSKRPATARAAREGLRPHISAVARWFAQGIPGRHVELAALALDVLAELPWLEGEIREMVLQAALDPARLPRSGAGRRDKLTPIAQTSAVIAALRAIRPDSLPEAELAACVGAWAQSKKHRDSVHRVAPYLARLPTAALREAAVLSAAAVDGRALALCTSGVAEQGVDGAFLLPEIDLALKAKKDDVRSFALNALEDLARSGDAGAKELVVACLQSRSPAVRERARRRNSHDRDPVLEHPGDGTATAVMPFSNTSETKQPRT